MGIVRQALVFVITIGSITGLLGCANSATDQSASTRELPTQRVVESGPRITVKQWFQAYDQIRRDAQMTPDEKSQSMRLMSNGITPGATDSDKQLAQDIVNKMVARYSRATTAMRQLPVIAQTQDLHYGYSKYFLEAGLLFQEYLKMQSNVLATDGGGKPLIIKLKDRKSELERLDASNKSLDLELRQKYQVASYRY
jgi:hypothetical protein